MKIFLKKFTNLVNFKIILIALTIALVLVPTKGFCATASGRASVIILASRENIKTNRIQIREKNRTKVQNIEIINF